MSSDLFERGGIFELDGVRRRPHMTLFMARFAQENVKSIRDYLKRTSGLLPRIRASHSGYLLTAGNYYEVSYERTQELLSLHRRVTEDLAVFRYSPGDPVVEDYFVPYSEAQQESAKKWGYDLTGDLYRPHITVTRFSRYPLIELPQPNVDLSFNVTRIGFFEADRLGATRNLIDQFALSVD